VPNGGRASEATPTNYGITWNFWTSNQSLESPQES